MGPLLRLTCFPLPLKTFFPKKIIPQIHFCRLFFCAKFFLHKTPPPRSSPLTKQNPPWQKKTPRDLNFERRHAMFATPHVKATLCFFVPKQSNFFCVFYIELQKVKVPRQKNSTTFSYSTLYLVCNFGRKIIFFLSFYQSTCLPHTIMSPKSFNLQWFCSNAILMKIAIKVTTKNPSKISESFSSFFLLFFWLKAFEPSFSWKPVSKCVCKCV